MDVVRGPGDTLVYERVLDYVAQRIAGGEFPRGSRLPSERDLAQRLGLSRVSVRRGFQELAAAGLIEAAPGHAWFVKPSVVEGPQNALQSFTELARERGLRPTARVVSACVRPSTLEEAELLRIAPGAPVADLGRVRLVDDIPMALDMSLVPAARTPGLLDLDWSEASLFGELSQRYGIVPTRAEYSVEAQAASASVADTLGLAPGQPILVTTGLTFDVEGRPIHYGRTMYRGDRYRFHANRSLAHPQSRPVPESRPVPGLPQSASG